ncbi:MAG: MarR family transcriptional regulator [Halioglobus sp.]
MPSRFEDHSVFLIYDITRLFRQVFGARLQDLELSESRWRVLGALSIFPAIGQTALAKHLAMGRAPLGEQVDKLQGEGLVERRPDPHDGRAKCLYITAKAEPLIGEIRDRSLALKADYLKGLGPDQLSELQQTLQRLYANLARLEPATTAKLAASELSFMHLVTCISRLNGRHFDQRLKALGFTRTQWLVLAGINASEGVQQNVLAQNLSMRKAPLGVLVDNLEQGRWVERRPHPQDRRAKQLFLSSRCTRQLESLSESFEALHLSTLQGILEHHQENLHAGLTQVRDNLKRLAQDSILVQRPGEE